MKDNIDISGLDKAEVLRLQGVADRIVKMLIEAVDDGACPYRVAVDMLDGAQDMLIEDLNDYELEVE